MFDAVSCVIPGVRRPDQMDENARAAELKPLSRATMTAVARIYDRDIRPLVHQLW
jgi:aryl-alcohol dehydrogenase-like predicted oxidoreductase